MDLSLSELLFFGGIVFMGISVISGLVASICFHIAKKRLNSKLEVEFGKRRR